MSSTYCEWPHAGWWAAKEAAAARMSREELLSARIDCQRAAQAFPRTTVESRYTDEGTVYAREMARRRGRA